MLTIRLANNNDQQSWDDFVLKQDTAGPYHLFAWKRAIEEAYQHRSYYLIAVDNQCDIHGALPLTHVKPPIIRGKLVSLPFCDYGGVFAEDDGVKKLIVDRALQISRSLGAIMEIRCKDNEPILDERSGFGVTSHKSRMILDLPDSADALWKAFKSKLRSQIRKPLKEGLEFKIGSTEFMNDFYAIFTCNMRDLGSPVHSRKWIEAVINAFGDAASVGVVYKDQTPVGVGIILICNDTVSIPWASTLREYNHLSPNMMLYWGFLEYACNNGFKHFDFGRSTPGEGTYKFKEQWGAKPKPLYWYRQGKKDQKELDFSGGRIRQKIETVWSNLPPSIVNSLGPVLRKYITL